MSSVEPEIHQSFAQSEVTRLSARRAYEQAWAQFAGEQTPEQFCHNWLVIQSHVVGGVADGVVILMKPATGAFTPVAFLAESNGDRSLLANVTERALREGRGVVAPRTVPGESAPRFQLAYPVRVDGRVQGVVGLDIDPRPEPRVQAAIRELQWGSGWLELLLRRHVDPRQSERQRLKVALDLVAALLEHARFRESASAFATQLASQLGCDRVSLGVLEGKRVKLRAVSHSAQFDARANLMRAVERAMEEALDQEASIVSPPLEDQPLVARAHEELLRESGAGSAATFPLAHAGRLVGAMTLERAAGHRFDPPTLEVCTAVASIAGPIVELKRAHDAGLPAHFGHATRGLWQKLAGPGHAGLKLATASSALLALVLAFASGPFRVSANATLEGAVQRAITAPVSGYVKEASLRAGDTVKEGQPIGSFDDRDLRLERMKLVSQREQYVRQSRDALARHDRAQAEIVASQIAQAEAQLALVEEQLTRMRLVAPFDGLIVSGDLSQNLGSPVEKGQVLFEVAPLEGYRVALLVDERDIAYVTSGQPGQLTVTSMPGERFAFTVNKVTPVNTAKEGRNFFRVEAKLEDAAKARLRPGMEGVGKIEIDERKYVWIWTRGLIDWLRLWLWSWTP